MLRIRLRSFAARIGLVLLVGLAANPLRADVKPNGLFTDNMVLQRDIRIPVWGTAEEGDRIAVSLGDKKADTVAKDGKWRVNLAPLPAGGPYKLVIEGPTNRFDLKNVMVGDVWIAGGQSNMEMHLRDCAGGPAAVAASANPQIRLFTVPRPAKGIGPATPQSDVAGSWSECGPNTVADFSGVAYFFGRSLEHDLKVPIGLINSNVGGTQAERWMSKAAFDAVPELKQMHAFRPFELYNGMIHPLIPFGIRGVIWYQGESNADQAWYYRKLFPAMIKDWRDEWKQGDFPFLFVQLAPWKVNDARKADHTWPELREAQLLTMLNVPKTAMAVITDVGDAKDIHPKRKQPVGERLALAARRALAYGGNREYSGPIYSSLTIKGNEAILHFQHVGSGLACKGDHLTGFTIAGADQKFHDAAARIDGDTVVVSSPDVAQPVAVRYGWWDVPVVNLWNKDDLPASPFRTDDFPMLTAPQGVGK